MYITNYTNSNFNVDNCKEYILSIQLSLNGLIFLLYDDIKKEIIYFQEKELDVYNEYQLFTEIDCVFQKETLFQNTFKAVKVFLPSDNFIITPSAIFSNENARDLLSTSTPVGRNQEVLSTYHKASRSYISFPIYTSLLRLINQHFPATQYFASWNIMLDLDNLYLKQNPQKRKVKFLFAHLNNDKLYLHIQEGNHFQFANSFTTKNTNDDVYFILNCFKNNHLDQKNDQIVISGKTREKGTILADLKKFVQTVNLLELNNFAIPEALIKSQSRQYYFRHIISALCE